jgi:hypothetical protein
MASTATSTKSHARFRWGAVNVLPPAENLMPLIENNTEPQRIRRQQTVRTHCFRFIVMPFWLSSKLPPNARTEWCRTSDLRTPTERRARHPLQHDSSAPALHTEVRLRLYASRAPRTFKMPHFRPSAPAAKKGKKPTGKRTSWIRWNTRNSPPEP